MSDLIGNHIVGFPTRRLICLYGVLPMPRIVVSIIHNKKFVIFIFVYLFI